LKACKALFESVGQPKAAPIKGEATTPRTRDEIVAGLRGHHLGRVAALSPRSPSPQMQAIAQTGGGFKGGGGFGPARVAGGQFQGGAGGQFMGRQVVLGGGGFNGGGGQFGGIEGPTERVIMGQPSALGRPPARDVAAAAVAAGVTLPLASAG